MPLMRYCSNCNKEFYFIEVNKLYPKSKECQDLLKKLWNNPKTNFYCSSCLILRLVKELKKIKNTSKLIP